MFNDQRTHSRGIIAMNFTFYKINKISSLGTKSLLGQACQAVIKLEALSLESGPHASGLLRVE